MARAAAWGLLVGWASSRSNTDKASSVKVNWSPTIDFKGQEPGTVGITDRRIGTSERDRRIENAVHIHSLPLAEHDLDATQRRTTPISRLQGGTGFDLQGGIVIRQGTKSYRVELSNALTIEDMINSIHKSGANVQASITPNGRSLQIISTESGTDFSIAD